MSRLNLELQENHLLLQIESNNLNLQLESGYGMQLDYTEETIDREYIYYSGVEAPRTYVPIPYGMKYPINKCFDGETDYNFCISLYINDELLEKDIDWREADVSECDGFMSSSLQICSGLGSNKGFANMVILLNDKTIVNGDKIRFVMKHRSLITNKVRGVRIGRINDPSEVWGDEIKNRTYHYGKNDGSTDTVLKSRHTDVYWTFPNADRYKVVLFNLNKKCTGHYTGSKPNTGRYHQGITWRIVDVTDSTNGRLNITNRTNRMAFKLATFDVRTGAISDLTQETIIRKWNNSWAGINQQPLNESLVLR